MSDGNDVGWVIKTVQAAMAGAQTEMLDALIARLLSPEQLHWRDCRAEAPPDYVEVLVVSGGEICHAHYRGEQARAEGQGLPSNGCWSQWQVRVRYDGAREGGYKIRWWMPMPIMPSEDA